MYREDLPETLSAILPRIEHFCAYQERCTRDVDEKLRSWKVSPEKRDFILQKLKAEHFLDDERFARAFVRGKFYINHWGRIKISHELAGRGIPERYANEAMKEISDEDYLQVIRQHILKKQKMLASEKPLIIRQKIINFVTGKGFEFSLIEKTLNELNI